jgi:hypothetical protein
MSWVEGVPIVSGLIDPCVHTGDSVRVASVFTGSSSLALHRQLPLLWRHLFPQHFQISLHS